MNVAVKNNLKKGYLALLFSNLATIQFFLLGYLPVVIYSLLAYFIEHMEFSYSNNMFWVFPRPLWPCHCICCLSLWDMITKMVLSHGQIHRQFVGTIQAPSSHVSLSRHVIVSLKLQSLVPWIGQNVFVFQYYWISPIYYICLFDKTL